MLDAIRKTLSNILPTVFSKSEYNDAFQYAVNNLDSITGYYVELSILVKDKKVEEFEFLSIINTELKLNKTLASDVLEEIHSFCIDLSKEQTKILAQVEKDMNDNNVDTVATAKSAVMFKILDDYYFFASYLTDLFLVITNEITKQMHSEYESEWLDEKRKVLFRGETYRFVKLVNIYKSLNVVEEIKKLPDLQIDLKNNSTDRILESSMSISKHKILNTFSSGFIYNPIYHIRKMLVDRDMENLKLLEEKKKLLEYKLLEIKTANKEGKLEDSKYTKAVKNIEEMISTLEYKIEKLK